MDRRLEVEHRVAATQDGVRYSALASNPPATTDLLASFCACVRHFEIKVSWRPEFIRLAP
jgi:hypothetical protein